MLRDCTFLNSYSTGFDEPKDFFTEALIESCQFDLGLGFFSSSGIRSLAYGFALFIANGGRMRIVINDILSPEDKRAIEKGQNNVIDDFEDRIITDIKKLSEVLSAEDEQFFNCLSYLIFLKRIEFIATISSKGGLAHDKYGIFTDAEGNKVAFIGSANFSQSALELNGETITTFRSGKDDERVKEYQSLFNSSWTDDTPHLIHIPLNKVKTYIQEKFISPDLNTIIEHEKMLRENPSSNRNLPLSDRLAEKIRQKEQEPRFPFPEERQIQKDAYKVWVENNRQGLFAMATGSGKTVTALNCVLKDYKRYGHYKAIIVVPTQALAIQWEQEAAAFNFQNIVSTHSSSDWKNTLNRYITLSYVNRNNNIIIITTYATFNRQYIQSFIHKAKDIEEFIYIADEAHNLGSGNSLSHIPLNIPFRIGLSATPERVYDDLGSSKVFEFFNSEPPKYTYRFTMKEAIESGILCHYTYTPIFVELTDDEMSEYEKITKQLRQFIDPDTGKYSEDAERLLLKRKRIIHKAQNKKQAISELLDNLQVENKLSYTFVFVPEGYENNYSNSSSYKIADEDIHIIDEYAEMFKQNGYSYHKYISGIEDAPSILKSFSNGDIKILLSMKCLDEGVDIPRAEYAIFCSSTGNPRQFVQRRGRVLRKCKGKDTAKIWDLVIIPPCISSYSSDLDRNLFISEVKRIVNFAALADNQTEIVYGVLKNICEQLRINLFEMLEEEDKQYN